MTCPISGKPVDRAIAMVAFKAPAAAAGSVVGFGCPQCAATCDEDPATCEAGLAKQLIVGNQEERVGIPAGGMPIRHVC